MKFLSMTALAAALVAIAAPTLADDHTHHGHQAAPQGQAADAPLVEGQVKKVDKASGKVTLSHGPMPNGMPAMTMAFRVKDPAWIDRMKEGDKIRFQADQVNGAMTVVKFEPVK